MKIIIIIIIMDFIFELSIPMFFEMSRVSFLLMEIIS